jgi:hypothetical protein
MTNANNELGIIKQSYNKEFICVIKAHKPFVMLRKMIIHTGVPS